MEGYGFSPADYGPDVYEQENLRLLRPAAIARERDRYANEDNHSHNCEYAQPPRPMGDHRLPRLRANYKHSELEEQAHDSTGDQSRLVGLNVARIVYQEFAQSREITATV